MKETEQKDSGLALRSPGGWRSNWEAGYPSKASWAPEAGLPSFSPASPPPPNNRPHGNSPSRSPNNEADKSPAKGTVLIVEDDTVSASALRTILLRLGWQVVEAQFVKQAVGLLNGPVDAVVLDLMLPDGDGIVVLEKIRAANADCRVVVTTGMSDPERLKKVRALRPEAILMKPIDLRELVRFLDSPRGN